ncbi:hypothetical protein LCGC14_3133600 [marine sediment metagenome]|uniref:Uncharacterized protein n=1 Tax=marine sediment metagenome TaxID=412755 RepID=A0A0F8WMV6_9ZZZZ
MLKKVIGQRFLNPFNVRVHFDKSIVVTLFHHRTLNFLFRGPSRLRSLRFRPTGAVAPLSPRLSAHSEYISLR